MSDWLRSDFKRAGGIKQEDLKSACWENLVIKDTQLKWFDNLFVFGMFEIKY